jgi:beta-glucosidase
VRRPARELRAFAKVELQPGESRTVELSLDRRSFAYWDIDQHDWIVAAGDYRVEVGADAQTIVAEVEFALAGDRVEVELTLDSTMAAWLDHPDVGASVSDMFGFSAAQVPEEHMAMVRSMTMQQFIRISGAPIPAEALEPFMAATRKEN